MKVLLCSGLVLVLACAREHTAATAAPVKTQSRPGIAITNEQRGRTRLADFVDAVSTTDWNHARTYLHPDVLPVYNDEVPLRRTARYLREALERPAVVVTGTDTAFFGVWDQEDGAYTLRAVYAGTVAALGPVFSSAAAVGTRSDWVIAPFLFPRLGPPPLLTGIPMDRRTQVADLLRKETTILGRAVFTGDPTAIQALEQQVHALLAGPSLAYAPDKAYERIPRAALFVDFRRALATNDQAAESRLAEPNLRAFLSYPSNRQWVQRLLHEGLLEGPVRVLTAPEGIVLFTWVSAAAGGTELVPLVAGPGRTLHPWSYMALQYCGYDRIPRATNELSEWRVAVYGCNHLASIDTIDERDAIEERLATIPDATLARIYFGGDLATYRTVRNQLDPQ
jgi:hypothetical protein